MHWRQDIPAPWEAAWECMFLVGEVTPFRTATQGVSRRRLLRSTM